MPRSCPSTVPAESWAGSRARRDTGTRGGAVASIADSHAKTSRSTCFEPTRVMSRRLKACVDAYPEERSTFSSSTGDHSYEGVRRDFELYSALVAAGGLVAFHDIVQTRPGGHGDPGDVPAFWSEVRNHRRVVAEFVEDWQWGSCGIGVIRL